MGCVTGAAAAWAAELAGGGPAGGRRAAAVIAAATIGSFGAGGHPDPGRGGGLARALPPVTFAAHLAFAALLLPLVARLPETLAAPQAGWFRRPGFPRGTLATTCAILPGWGVDRHRADQRAIDAWRARGQPLTGPLAACGMMLVGVVAQQVFRRMAPRRAVAVGLAVLMLGAGLTFWGTAGGGLWPLLVGGAVVGVGSYAFIYLGGLAAVAEAASGEDRARAVAGYFVVAHLGFSAVPLLVGLAVDGFGAAAALAATWVVLAAAALWLAGSGGPVRLIRMRSASLAITRYARSG